MDRFGGTGHPVPPRILTPPRPRMRRPIWHHHESTAALPPPLSPSAEAEGLRDLMALEASFAVDLLARQAGRRLLARLDAFAAPLAGRPQAVAGRCLPPTPRGGGGDLFPPERPTRVCRPPPRRRKGD